MKRLHPNAPGSISFASPLATHWDHEAALPPVQSYSRPFNISDWRLNERPRPNPRNPICQPLSAGRWQSPAPVPDAVTTALGQRNTESRVGAPPYLLKDFGKRHWVSRWHFGVTYPTTRHPLSCGPAWTCGEPRLPSPLAVPTWGSPVAPPVSSARVRTLTA